MRFLLRLLIGLWLAGPAALCASSSLEHARSAQAMLGPGTWSRVVRITNVGARGEYSAEFAALVFEFSGILWFYSDANGTQSLSLEMHRLAADKADLAPLVRAIAPGLSLRETLAGAGEERAAGEVKRPPNDCFIASVAALQALLARGELIAQARLLSYYVDTRRGRLGHTLLTYTTSRGAFAFDPAGAGRPQVIARGLADDALALARWLRGGDPVAKARWVPAPVRPAVQLAAWDGPALPGARGRTLRLR